MRLAGYIRDSHELETVRRAIVLHVLREHWRLVRLRGPKGWSRAEGELVAALVALVHDLAQQDEAAD